jgi:endo-1,4-beta-xylanase
MEEPIVYQNVGTKKGTVTSDGGTYEIWEHQQTNQPYIKGTTTFQQYISIRQTPRSSGTVTVQNHFDAWKAAGMQCGSFNYQVLAVESWSGSGNAQLTVSKGSNSTS